MSILRLTLKKKWFDLIASGEKKEEYREKKEYWTKRLCLPIGIDARVMRKWEFVEFKNGYGKNSPTLLVKCEFVHLGASSHPEWGGDPVKLQYIIKLGEIVEKKNIQTNEDKV